MPTSELVHIARVAKKVRDAEEQLYWRRRDLDYAIGGALTGPEKPTVASVARAAEISRETVYQSLDRYRADQEAISAAVGKRDASVSR
jgi:hypothetical protein